MCDHYQKGKGTLSNVEYNYSFSKKMRFFILQIDDDVMNPIPRNIRGMI